MIAGRARYGEDYPAMVDDSLPIVLLVLDGLGDRFIPELGNRTPSEAANTPVLDQMAAIGASGWHLPFGWGRATSSELAHWALFGYEPPSFPGRAALEAAGASIAIPPGTSTVHGSLRTSEVREDGQLWITGRPTRDDLPDAEALLNTLTSVAANFRIDMRKLDRPGRGEITLFLPDSDGGISDSDPFFEDFHPWLRPRSTTGDAAAADNLTEFLLECRRRLLTDPVNLRRTDRGIPMLDVLTTKWAGTLRQIPSFLDHVGVSGAAVTSTQLYRGIASLLAMADYPVAPNPSPEHDIRARLEVARGAITNGARFVHVHTKATDEAGHAKSPFAKRDVLESLDRGLEALLTLATEAIVIVTGDHATPSTGGVLHTGDPTPLVVAGPTVRADRVEKFGEQYARDGDLGILSASDVLPLALGFANRPNFLGHRPTTRRTLALPEKVEAMPVDC